MRPSCASRKPAQRSRCRSTATAATVSLSPREGAKLLVAECCRNLSTVGALPVAATNNLNFGNPERPEIMAQLVEAIEGIAEACRFSKRRSPAAMSACTTKRWAKASSPRR